MADDVVIVGAGPAGAVAAIHVARAGARVRLVDRARFPRDKLCGDTINPGTLALLERSGAAVDVRRRSRAVTGMLLSEPGGATLAADYPDGLTGAALRRSVFDHLLIEHAVAAGVIFDEGVEVIAPECDEQGRVTGVSIRRGDRHRAMLRARVVIAADGRQSRLAAAFGLTRWSATRRWAFGACYAGVAGTTDHGEMHVRHGSYIGIAPLPDGSTNVCVVRDLARCRSDVRVLPHGVIDHAVRGDEFLIDRFACASRVSAVMVLGPLGVDVGGAGVPGLLLAGDAAGFVDPMTGDGLRFAIRGGELAAEAAMEELASGRPAHVRLAASRRADFAGKTRFNRAVRWLTSSGSAMRATGLLARCWTSPFEPLIGIAGDCGLARRLACG